MYVKLLGSTSTALRDIIRNIDLPSLAGKSCSIAGELAQDTVSLGKRCCERIKALDLYNSGKRETLFFFKSKGEISTLIRERRSPDLNFLSHIQTGKYVPPKISPEGTHGISAKALEQSNRLAKDIIPDSEILVDGFRYHGPNAIFDTTGKNISRFRNGKQEITIMDRTIDTKLSQTIEAFKARLSGKNYTEQEKMQELLKYVDEVLSVEKSGKATEALVSNMESSSLTNEVLLGEIINSGAGLCRHRSLLTKVLGDEIGLKTSVIHGNYGNGGHAWNEIVTSNGERFLSDAMHGSIFDVSDTSKSVMPQVFAYRVTDPKNANKLIGRYFNPDDTTGLIYRKLAYGQDITIPNVCEITPSTIGKFKISPQRTEDIFVNGSKITSPSELYPGDWVQIKSLGFQI